MKMSKLVGRRIKETPRDANTPSHVYLIRGGYIRPVSAGIYTLLPIGLKVVRKIEQIIREELNRIDGQEVLMPVAVPAELWKESGRYQNIGAELLRFHDRNNKEMVLCMTHEEAVCHLARTELSSYKQLPSMLYHIQTKYRDEARPRAGLIRVREFTMKDAYSFHASAECMSAYYMRVHEAYKRIFRRLGMNDVLSIQSDLGMMGGEVAHEFMAVAECGEDTIFVTEDGSYQANRDVAQARLEYVKEDPKQLEKVHTPDRESIEDVAAFLDVTPAQTGKAVFYANENNELIFAVIRGDLEVNETKLQNLVQAKELRFATDEEITAIGATPGYASAMDLNADKVRILFDHSARESSNLVVGANEPDYHFRNFNFDRDIKNPEDVEVVDIAAAREGDPDPVNGMPLIEKRGIEVGNIFQLGTKYSTSMNCQFLDENGKSHPFLMGCYGIGVGRAMAAVIEQNYDKFGPVWPFSVAPFEVHICALNLNKEGVLDIAEKLYFELTNQGIDVLFDDRNEKAGFAFNDADLIGAPYRLVISPKNLENGQVEFKTRDGSRKEMLPIKEAVQFITTLVEGSRTQAQG